KVEYIRINGRELPLEAFLNSGGVVTAQGSEWRYILREYWSGSSLETPRKLICVPIIPNTEGMDKVSEIFAQRLPYYPIELGEYEGLKYILMEHELVPAFEKYAAIERILTMEITQLYLNSYFIEWALDDARTENLAIELIERYFESIKNNMGNHFLPFNPGSETAMDSLAKERIPTLAYPTENPHATGESSFIDYLAEMKLLFTQKEFRGNLSQKSVEDLLEKVWEMQTRPIYELEKRLYGKSANAKRIIETAKEKKVETFGWLEEGLSKKPPKRNSFEEEMAALRKEYHSHQINDRQFEIYASGSQAARLRLVKDQEDKLNLEMEMGVKATKVAAAIYQLIKCGFDKQIVITFLGVKYLINSEGISIHEGEPNDFFLEDMQKIIARIDSLYAEE
ncbi:MAG: hypothetical protein ACOCXP_02510, partial [Candidatus Dojkabacteria bacterium]